jgi:hypothetical protein
LLHDYGSPVAAFWADVLPRGYSVQSRIGAEAAERYFWASTSGAKVDCGFASFFVFQFFNYFTKIGKTSHIESLCLLDFNVCLWVALTDKVFSDFVSVVALQNDFIVFCGSSAGAESFEFLG